MLSKLFILYENLIQRLNILKDRLDQIKSILNLGYKFINKRNSKERRKVKLSTVQRMKLEQKIPLISIEIFELKKQIKEVNYQIKAKRKKIKNNNVEIFRNKVQKNFEKLNKRIIYLFEKVLKSDGISELRNINNLLTNIDQENKLNHFKKLIIPILNKSRIIEKHPPITSIRNQVAQDIMQRVINLR